MLPVSEYQPIAGLRDFLLRAAIKGYGSETPDKKIEKDSSDTISVEEGSWRLRDNYFTSVDGRRFHGTEVVTFMGKPFWFMAYSGFVSPNEDPGEIYRFLKKALLNAEPSFPIRGPYSIVDEGMSYKFDKLSDDLAEFTAHESILLNENRVYEAHFIGGLID